MAPSEKRSARRMAVVIRTPSATGARSRPLKGRMPRRLPHEGHLAGVCAGLAHYFGTDVRAVRAAFVLLIFAGVGVVIDAVLWELMPAQRSPR